MKNVNLMLGRFQPLTNGHIKCIEYAWKAHGLPTVIALIRTKEEKLDPKRPFPSYVLKNIYNKLFRGDSRVVDIVEVSNADIVKNSLMLRELGYNIKSWTCGTDRYNIYNDMSIKYSEDAQLDSDFKCLEIQRCDDDISATKVRESILSNDINTFNKLTPYSTLQENNSVFDELKSYIERSK